MSDNMDKEKLQSVYNTLSRYRSEYYGSSGRAQYLYVKLNQGSGSGLFKHTFFQGDLDRSLSILEKELG